MSEDEAFITEASEQFGNRGAKQAQQILEQAAAMFAGGSLTDEDKIAFEEIEDMVQNEDLDYFGLCSDYSGTLRATCPDFESHHSGEWEPYIPVIQSHLIGLYYIYFLYTVNTHLWCEYR